MFKYLILLALLFSCNKNSSPEAVLKDFIDLRSSQKLETSDLEDYLTGALLEEYTEALAEDPNKLNDLSKFKKYKYKVIYKNCAKNKCTITYSISYQAKASDDKTSKDVEISSKKIAELTQIEDRWFISGISDVKSYYEFKN